MNRQEHLWLEGFSFASAPFTDLKSVYVFDFVEVVLENGRRLVEEAMVTLLSLKSAL